MPAVHTRRPLPLSPYPTGRRVSKAIHHQGIRVVGADDMLHTATAYHGRTLEGKRRAAVFFWMAKA